MIVQIRLSEVQLAPGLLVQGLLKYTYNIHTPILCKTRTTKPQEPVVDELLVECGKSEVIVEVV